MYIYIIMGASSIIPGIELNSHDALFAKGVTAPFVEGLIRILYNLHEDFYKELISFDNYYCCNDACIVQ